MRIPARVVACVLPLLLSACFHKTQQAQVQPLAPPIQEEPLPKPQNAPANLPPPVVTVPAPPQSAAAPAATPPAKTKKPPVRRRHIANHNPEEASNGAAGVSAIGQLSSGDPADYRRQTEESIAAVERGLNGINRPLDSSEQKTAQHIREFLKQAKAALASGDVDGAHTLTAKARVLLGELTGK